MAVSRRPPPRHPTDTSGSQTPESEPAVLLVGADRAFHDALAAALSNYNVFVENVETDAVYECAQAAAPDLILLMGDSALGGGTQALQLLSGSPQTSVIPVAILADDAALAERLKAFRHGATAVIPLTASVDAIAVEIAHLAREIPDRDGTTTGQLGDTTLDELVRALTTELRSGILSVRGGATSDEEAIRLVLGGGRPLAQTIDEFVSQLREHVVHAEPLHYEFDERAGGTVQFLGGDSLAPPGAPEDVAGLRLLIADKNSGRADAVAQALRSHDIEATVTDFDVNEARVSRLRQVDPAILLISDEDLRGDGYALVRLMRQDTRLRWASLLVVPWDEVWPEDTNVPHVDEMLATLATLAEPEHSIRDRIRSGLAFDTRLEVTGPARMLRALMRSPHMLRVSVFNTRAYVQVDISDELVVGANGEIQGDDPFSTEGIEALSTLLVLGSGRVHIEKITHAQSANVMATIAVALTQSEGSPPPLAPSIPAPSGTLPPPPIATQAEPAGSNPLATVTTAATPKAKLIAIAVIASALCLVLGIVLTRGGDSASVVASVNSTATAPQKAEARPWPSPSATAGDEVAPGPAPSAHVEEADVPAEPEEPAGDPPGAVAELTSREVQNIAPSCETLVGAAWELLLRGNREGQSIIELRLGRKAMVRGDIGAAQTAFCRASAMDPANLPAVSSLVRLFMLQGDLDQSQDWAKIAAKHHPSSVDTQVLLGDTLARVGKLDEARALWMTAAKLEADNSKGIERLANRYHHAGTRALKGSDWAQADRFFRRCVILRPEWPDAATGLAEALFRAQQNASALGWMRRALGLGALDANTQVLYGDILIKNAENDEAVKAWQIALSLDPTHKKARRRLAQSR
ncbi:MAG: tetratricopeptide repeat protein [Polyangiaceae bacterium]|nr:tetratricopeptide repeat protein [Polyangiaceae bacterium]